MALITLNSFLEDTSVLVAGAYLVVRGPMERIIKTGAWLGLLGGGFAATEAFLPDDRFPYSPPTLACAFAAIVGGTKAGLISAIVATLAAAALLPTESAELIAIQVVLTLVIVSTARRLFQHLWWCVMGTALAQYAGTSVAAFFPKPIPVVLGSPLTVPANAFGLVLLMLVLNDARLRADSHRHRHEVDEALRAASEARLAIVRSRVHPHFLFNALNSIAALCVIAPQRASDATVQLGKLMRRSLEFEISKGIPLKDELETVESYLAIEQERFGPKLCVKFHVSGSEELQVPAFSVQILVENAVLHGISQKTGGGTVLLLTRTKARGVSVAVIDDGSGIDMNRPRGTTPHGLTILRDQLHAIFGPDARLHVVKREAGGTLAVFRVPLPHPAHGLSA